MTWLRRAGVCQGIPGAQYLAALGRGEALEPDHILGAAADPDDARQLAVLEGRVGWVPAEQSAGLWAIVHRSSLWRFS